MNAPHDLRPRVSTRPVPAAMLDALRAQIALDSQTARDWLAANPLPA